MRAVPLFPIIFLILGHFLIPTFATPVSPDAAPKQMKRFCRLWACRNGVEPIWMQTLSPNPSPTLAATPSDTVVLPTVTPTVLPTVPLNSTSPGDDSGSDTQPTPGSKAGSSLSSVNAGVALSSRGTLFFTVLAGVIATSLMF
ncbi:hypothetical protein EDB85DRAFT_1888713 [Lactarius pseudohatsudake]|nr:hypothetical protein EDB85DRAFT_1888713 [Lactarius pseudohatsudake]